MWAGPPARRLVTSTVGAIAQLPSSCPCSSLLVMIMTLSAKVTLGGRWGLQGKG